MKKEDARDPFADISKAPPKVAIKSKAIKKNKFAKSAVTPKMNGLLKKETQRRIGSKHFLKSFVGGKYEESSSEEEYSMRAYKI